MTQRDSYNAAALKDQRTKILLNNTVQICPK